MKEQTTFIIDACKGFEFRFMKLPATELLALQTQLNFDEFEKAKFATKYILEHTEVEVAGQWLPVKEKNREVYYPQHIDENITALNSILTMFLTNVIKPLFQKSNE